MSKQHEHQHEPEHKPAHKPAHKPEHKPDHPSSPQAPPEPTPPSPAPQQPQKASAKTLLGELHTKVQGNSSVEASSHDLLHGLADALEKPGADLKELARELRTQSPTLVRAVFENTPHAGVLDSAHAGQVYTEPQGGSYEGSEKQKHGGK